EVVAAPHGRTARYLTGAERIPVPERRRPIHRDRRLRIVGARQNNLKNLTVDIPLGVFNCVTGVSGSGKSSLVNDILKRGVRSAELGTEDNKDPEGEGENGVELRAQRSALRAQFDSIEGTELIDKVIDIDQGPIGR